MFTKTTHLALIALASIAFAATTRAESVLYSASFSTALDPVLPGGPTEFAGTFTFRFNESIVGPTETQTFVVALDSLSITDIGATTFTTENTGLLLIYQNGSIIQAALSGKLDYETAGGNPTNFGAVGTGTNDFLLTFDGYSHPWLDGAPFLYAVVATEGAAGLSYNTSPSTGSIEAVSVVPEPASMAMGLMAVVGVAMLARRRSS